MFRLSCLLIILSLCSCASTNKAPLVTTKTREEQQILTPWQALQKLKLGNERFLAGNERERELRSQLISAKKQFPFAVVYSCMDSRGSPELIFDQGIGDIFAERLAGNVLNEDVLGGMEFATKITGAKLIVVMGHTSCGAIHGACKGAKLGNLTALLSKIEPAVEQVRKSTPDFSCDRESIVDGIAEQQVKMVMHEILKKSPVINSLLEQKLIGLVGAIHDLSTGHVNFIEEKALIPGAPQ